MGNFVAAVPLEFYGKRAAAGLCSSRKARWAEA